MNTEPWYGIKLVFRHSNLEVEMPGASVYEERVILVSANSEDEAISLAELEAVEYAKDVDGCEYLEFASCFHIYEEKIVHLSEVYSVMRESSLSSEQYLDTFYDTDLERERS